MARVSNPRSNDRGFEVHCIDDIKTIKLNNTAVTIGKFDGLHLGHRKLLEVLKENSGESNLTVMTFAAKPIDIIHHEDIKTIVTETEKQLLCQRAGIDYYIKLPLTKDFLDLSPEAFVRDVLVGRLDVRLVVCGPDFTFGSHGTGNVQKLKQMGSFYGFHVLVVPKEQYNNIDIGSTQIRQLIAQGNLSLANKLLGHPYSVVGTVTEGKKLGRKMGLPTANILPAKEKLLPPFGVYRTKMITGDKALDSITNIGLNPTVEDNDTVKIETHIIDGGEDLYNEIIEVQFFDFIRPEKKFSGIEELTAQINQDIAKARELSN